MSCTRLLTRLGSLAHGVRGDKRSRIVYDVLPESRRVRCAAMNHTFTLPKLLNDMYYSPDGRRPMMYAWNGGQGSKIHVYELRVDRDGDMWFSATCDTRIRHTPGTMAQNVIAEGTALPIWSNTSPLCSRCHGYETSDQKRRW